MDSGFWLQRWEKNEIGFHENDTNTLLVENFDELTLEEGSHIFIPLCGKTLDISWLLSKGYRVSGAELSKSAIDQLFVELGVEPKILNLGKINRYSAENIDIYVGDIFELTQNILGKVDATYDRAALVALPEEMRKRYTAHLLEITATAPQLLFSYEYDQDLMDGPPFSVRNTEVEKHYKDYYQMKLLKSIDVPGGLKGVCKATESAWLLANR